MCLNYYGWFLIGVYVLALRSSGCVWTHDSAHTWQFYDAASLGNQAAGTIPLSHIILTLSKPVLALSC